MEVREKRKYRIVHEGYLTSWITASFPPGSWQTNVRLGAPVPEMLEPTIGPEEVRALKLWLPQADAVVILPDRVFIVEALVRPEWWKIFVLYTYVDLFGKTEEFREHWGKPRQGVILSTMVNRYWQAQAEQLGIRFVIHRPAMVEEYLGALPRRMRRPATGVW